MIALLVGMIVCYAAFLAFRTASQTISQLRHLAQQNRLMREGFSQALDELDWWTIYDDPVDATHQGLRGGTPYANPSGPLTTIDRDWVNPVPTGLAFTSFSRFPRPNLDGRPATELVPVAGDPLVIPAADLTSESVWRIDRWRGWDATRPYQANDPRRWWRGNLAEQSNTAQHFGRYAMFSNLKSAPVLGYQTWDNTTGDATWTTATPVPTGPYGTVDDGVGLSGTAPGERMPYTWLANQHLFLHDAIGNYGVVEYLPSNSILQFYGSHAKPGGALTDVDERSYQFYIAAFGFGGIFRPNWWPHLGQLRWGDVRSPTPLLQSMYSTNAIFPISQFTGAPVVGQGVDAWINGDNGDGTNLGVAADRMRYHARSWWPGGTRQIYELHPLINRATILQPLLPLRPKEWPDLQLSVFRAQVSGRFLQQVRVRWTDQTTGEVCDLPINGFGTTLRGARQQRLPGTGWARWFGPGNPQNDATLDSMP